MLRINATCDTTTNRMIEPWWSSGGVTRRHVPDRVAMARVQGEDRCDAKADAEDDHFDYHAEGHVAATMTSTTQQSNK